MAEDDGPRVLLVEGQDDLHFVREFCKRCALNADFAVLDAQGYEHLRQALDVHLDVAGRQALGIVVDADERLDRRWQSLRDKLTECGYRDLPAAPPAEGLVIRQAGRPTLGVWLMPDNTLPGMLEHFVAFLVPAADDLWPLTTEALALVPEDRRRYAPRQAAKARLHTWLAWQAEPGTRLGQAVTKRYLSVEPEAAQRFAGWLDRLFGALDATAA
jgi:hypothetical protein